MDDVELSIGIRNESLHLEDDLDPDVPGAPAQTAQQTLAIRNRETEKGVPVFNEEPGLQRPVPVDLQNFSKPGARSFDTTMEFMDILQALSVDGPLMLTDNLWDFIGKGAQFNVYRNHVRWPFSGVNKDVGLDIQEVAVKRSLFEVHGNERLDISSEGSKKKLHDMHLEVIALRHPKLRIHRNIVKLLGWSYGLGFHQMPFLVFEIAVGDLTSFLQKDGDDQRWSTKHHLCLDMGVGLDALHDNGIIHGDFKPANVLVFANQSSKVPFIAKLADFGFSTAESQSVNNGLIQLVGYTPGWSAPEVLLHHSKQTLIASAEYSKADIYSFGLVLWSVLCFKGGAPPLVTSSAADVAVKNIRSISSIPDSICRTFCNALKTSLCFNHSERPAKVGDLLKDQSESYKTWSLDHDSFYESQANSASLNPTNSKDLQRHEWALPEIDKFYMEGLEASFEHYHKSMSAGELFAIFLARSHSLITCQNVSIESNHIKALLEASEKGFVPAQAVTNRVLASYGLSLPPTISGNTKIQWLFQGAVLGSLVALADLRDMNPKLAEEATGLFHKSGGFHQYSPEPLPPSRIWRNSNLSAIEEELGIHCCADKSKYIHSLAIWGNYDAIDELLMTFNTSVNSLNPSNETALYQACKTGSIETVKILCKHGADASLPGRPKGASCLHWLFNFSPDDVQDCARMLVDAGGDPNAFSKSLEPVISYHFPFKWPMGTPLHWAAGNSNPHAFAALLNVGADVMLRNGIDPYVDDLNVRYMEGEGNPGQGYYSFPLAPCEGFSALDVAVANHDWRILETLQESQIKNFDLSQADEEGYTPFHRLQYSWVGRTFAETRFWYLAFTGPRATRKDAILRTVQALQTLGGDINGLTKPSVYNQRRDKPLDKLEPLGNLTPRGHLTPLMLAVTKCDFEAVDVLLKCGANPNVQNHWGLTALSHLPEYEDPLACPNMVVPIVRALLSHGASPTLQKSEVTPVQSAAYAGSLEALGLLFEAGASPTEKVNGMNVLAMLVAQKSVWLEVQRHRSRENIAQFEARLCELIEKHMLQYPDSLEENDEEHGTFVHYVARSGMPDAVDALIRAKAKTNGYKEFREPKKKPISYNAHATWSYYGTPLDMVEFERQKILKAQDARNYEIGPSDYSFALHKLDQVDEVLLRAGGRASQLSPSSSTTTITSIRPLSSIMDSRTNVFSALSTFLHPFPTIFIPATSTDISRLAPFLGISESELKARSIPAVLPNYVECGIESTRKRVIIPLPDYNVRFTNAHAHSIYGVVVAGLHPHQRRAHEDVLSKPWQRVFERVWIDLGGGIRGGEAVLATVYMWKGDMSLLVTM